MISRFNNDQNMQYKICLFLFPIVLLSGTALAQEHQDFTISPKNKRIIVTDTVVRQEPSGVVLKQEAKTKEEQPQQAVPATEAVAKNEYKSVPLAGHKSYFGSMNDYVVEYTRQYMTRHQKTLSVVQDRSNKHFSLIDNVLQQHNIPTELKYLAVIESALNNNARSRVGAVGPWQFMASTARFMGLTVNGKRDDRKDWFKSTNAAARYLNHLYEELNDWLLVIAAYNSGPSPVRRAMQRTGSNNFWDIKKYLPRETQGHVLAFIATASIFENMSRFAGMGHIPEDFSFSEEATATTAPATAKQASKLRFTDEELKRMVIVRISEPIAMSLLAHDLGIEKNLLRKWNPDYELFELDTYDQDYYSLRIPKEKLDDFISRKENITKKSRAIYADGGF